jgi:hypothetical protein
MHLFIRCRPQPNPTIRMQVINLPRKRWSINSFSKVNTWTFS